MNWEIIQAYFIMGSVIGIVYLTFKIADDGIDVLINFIQDLIHKPEPNRRRFKAIGVDTFGFEEMFELSDACDMFGFYDYEEPIMKHDLKNRFKIRVKKAHPDHGGNVEDFIQVKKAYDFLLPRSI